MVIGTRLRLVALSLAAGSASFVLADTPPTRAVIRGSGKDVSIVYQIRPAAPAGAARPNVAAASDDPLSEAIRMKTAGASDGAVTDYLVAHESRIPDIVGADVLLQLRRAGAGEPVLALLSSYAAVDIGETGEGGPPPSGAGADVTAYGGLEPDLVSMGYPFYGGGYSGGGYAGGGGLGNGRWGRWGMFGRRGLGPGFGHHPAFHQSSAFFRFGPSFFPRPRPLPVFPGRTGGHTVARVGRPH